MTQSQQTTRQYKPRRRRSALKGIAISVASLAALIAVTLMLMNSAPQVSRITVAKALDDQYEVVEAADVFHPKDTFFVSVKVNNYRSEQMIEARWRFDGQPIRETRLETHGAAGDITAGFSLSNTEPWAIGRYSVEIVNGDSILASAAFRVEP